MKKIILILAAITTLSACDDDKPVICPKFKPDQKVRERVFMECLKHAKNTPITGKYNDSAEVVEECASSAYYISLRDQCETEKK